MLDGQEADPGALNTRAALLEQRLTSKQAELENKTAMVELGTQLEQALTMAVAEKRPQAQSLACQVGRLCTYGWRWIWVRKMQAWSRRGSSCLPGAAQWYASGQL